MDFDFLAETNEPNQERHRILDVVIHTTAVLNVNPPLWGLLQDAPPVKDRRELDGDLWIGTLGSSLASKIMDACDPAGLWQTRPIRQYGELYSFVRERATPISNYIEWDEDSRLVTCVSLSRLVHPTSVSYKYAARVVLRMTGEIAEIIPGPGLGLGAEAFLPTTVCYRNWLTDNDIDELRGLLRRFPTLSGLPNRVSRALWYYEYAARTYYVDVRWVLICTALQSLVHTDSTSSGSQFRDRIAQMAEELGIPVTLDETRKAYDHRSNLAHGQGLPRVEPRLAAGMYSAEDAVLDVDLYNKFEALLRLASLRALNDVNFRNVFSSNTSIRSRWPLFGKQPTNKLQAIGVTRDE